MAHDLQLNFKNYTQAFATIYSVATLISLAVFVMINIFVARRAYFYIQGQSKEKPDVM